MLGPSLPAAVDEPKAFTRTSLLVSASDGPDGGPPLALPKGWRTSSVSPRALDGLVASADIDPDAAAAAAADRRPRPLVRILRTRYAWHSANPPSAQLHRQAHCVGGDKWVRLTISEVSF